MPRSAPPGPSSGSSPAPAHDVDEVYLASRGRLLLQAYALTGDLPAATAAVHEAYAAAAHRWRRVGSLADPEGWIRSRLYQRADPDGRRILGRDQEPAPPGQPEVRPDEQQRLVLVALGHLETPARQALVLTHLAGLDLAATSTGLGLGEEQVSSLVREALESMRRGGALDDVAGPALEEVAATDPGPHVSQRAAAALAGLAPLLDEAALLDPAQLRSSARRRTRVRAGVAVGVTLALLAGLLLLWPGTGLLRGAEDAAPPEDTAGAAASSTVPVEEAMLLRPIDVRRLDPRQEWSETGTSDNTEGDGINTVCQTGRFADPEGEGTLVRTFAASGSPARTVLQTVEVSRTTSAAVDAYRTTLDWFAGCREARLQLLGSYRIDGIGSSAEVLELRVPTADERRTYVVGVVRSGEVTISTVTETRGGSPVDVVRATQLLREAAARLCEASAAGSCPGRARVDRVLPPLSGEIRGMLATADLPPIGRVNRAWVGTRPTRARPNAAATSCDGANFVRNGAPQATARTFVIPGARLPDRFGITQTVGDFPRPARAQAFVDDVIAAMAACEDDDLSAQVQEVLLERNAFRGSSLGVWRLDSEVSEDRTVGFWMGLARVGPHVSQVLFTPTDGADLDADQFRAVTARSRDRLFELTGAPR